MKKEHFKFVEGDKKCLQANILYLYNSFPNCTWGQNPLSFQINGKIILFQYIFVLKHWGVWVLWIQISSQ